MGCPSLTDSDSERRHHYQNWENVPLSEAVLEAVDAHESAEAVVDEAALYERLDIETLDQLFTDTGDVALSVALHLPNVTVGIWQNGPVNIRVADGAQ